MMLTSEKIVCPTAFASAEQRRPSLDRFKQDSYFQGSDGDITLRMLRRLTRHLGKYSLENEGRLARDIIYLIEHDIKKGTENDLMNKPYVNKLNRDGAIYKEIYLATKNVMLEFGKLMSEGASEHMAMAEHRDEGAAKEKKNEADVIWLLRFELKRLELIMSSERYGIMINTELHDELAKYVRILMDDLEKFENAHGLLPLHQMMNPEAKITSSE